jgi:hypothetical protein
MSIIPPPTAEGGAAVAASAIQPQNPIVPTFKLPNDGAKPEDRKFKDGRQYSAEELKDQEADKASASFLALSEMVLKPSFADMFYRLYDGKVSEVDTLQRQAFEKADIGTKGTYSRLLLTNPEAVTKRRNSYDRIGFYHETPPGVRFKGKM